MNTFSDPDSVAKYAEAPPRLVPGFHDLQRMAALLLAENTEADAQILVLGAGGGLELKVFAEWNPDWAFIGVDPSAEMLDLAKKTVGPEAARMRFHKGYIDSAPLGPYDAATCILTLHFIPEDERLRTLVELRKRLKPGAALIVAHHSFPQAKEEKSKWLARYAAFAISNGVPAKNAEKAANAIGNQLPALSPKQDEALLRRAGFSNVSLFYAGLTFRGWIAFNS
ncbi:MAG: class I SAM-dependent methyltransferase [Rhodobacteraceae bacterium]|nr:class I SAM-dependent methyltransferase [Paracoccaceae bacterium]